MVLKKSRNLDLTGLFQRTHRWKPRKTGRFSS